MLDDAATTAERAVAAGADVLAERYRALDTGLDAEFRETDVKAAADVAAEETILPVLRQAFPEHRITAEESGDHPGSGEGGPSPYRWIVDPLDGTNDYAAGLPTFATAVTLERDGEAVVAAAALPATGERYLAVQGGGLEYDGETVRAESARPLERATVATTIGRAVALDPEQSARAASFWEPIEAAAKRRVAAWAPVVYWGLVGRGLVDGMVAYRPDEEEQLLGELFAAEAGAATAREGGVYVAAANEALLEEIRTALPE